MSRLRLGVCSMSGCGKALWGPHPHHMEAAGGSVNGCVWGLSPRGDDAVLPRHLPKFFMTSSDTRQQLS